MKEENTHYEMTGKVSSMPALLGSISVTFVQKNNFPAWLPCANHLIFYII